MKKLLMMIGAAAVAVGAYAVEYTYTGGTVSPADGNVTILCNDGGAITNLTMAAPNAETMALGGDNLAFAAGANVKVIGNALVSNTFTTAGALVFSGVTNATWRGDYLTSDSTTLFTGVNLDHIVPLSGYGKRGTAEAEETDAFLYRAFYVVRDGNTMRFELQQIHSKYAKGIFIELTQSDDNIIGRRLLGGYRNSDKYGQQMFKYENGTASMVGGTENADYTPMTLEIGPRSGTPSALTFAVSGTETLNAVSGSGLTVTFEGAGANAKVKASGANTMTSGGFVVKGDAQNPIEYEVAAKYALPTEIECQGTATLKFSTAGTSGDGASKDTDAIVMRPGSTLQITQAYPFHYASGMVVLDGATMSHETTGNAYLNFLTLTNGATISLRSTGTFRGGYNVDSPLWTVTGAGRSTYDGDLTLMAKAASAASSSYQYLTIDVGDTVAGDGTDFLVTGNIVNYSSYKMASFIKAGAGTMEIDGTIQTANIPVRVAEGVLLLGRSGATAAGVDFSLEGGTLALAAGTANAVADVTLTESSTISVGEGATLTIASLTVPEGSTLSINGDVLRHVKVSTALDAATLSRILVNGKPAFQAGSGYFASRGLTIVFY